VVRVLDEWLAHPDGIVLVATGHADQPIAMARTVLLSAQEAWAQGARVHPQFRRQGIGKRLNDALCDWAARKGAQVMRLAVEDWNEPARGQVGQLGYRPVSDWVMAERELGEATPDPGGDGGRRISPPEQIQPAPSSEAEPAYLAWVRSEAARSARELFPVGWSWRRLTKEDLDTAARAGSFWEGRPGWAIARREEDTFRASWMATNPEDGLAMVRAIVDRATLSGADRLEVMAPAVGWLTHSLRGAGLELHPLTVYAKAIS
jgi:hypothetical protein